MLEDPIQKVRQPVNNPVYSLTADKLRVLAVPKIDFYTRLLHHACVGEAPHSNSASRMRDPNCCVGEG